ncbi:ABC transporter permease [Massilia sp. WF1]|uniref:ABC transporter permease n=1 Tax=unclassified Massilia TaxID=2609279 RepID=UPI000691241A|nr:MULTISPECIES: FtsX-like permease family protein [unclassified Massilia]ALK95345.1 ABC transporter permease [Massilia sp. WG5]KNZ67325.1 ABC transporter permease [Massilia sp. WF1]
MEIRPIFSALMRNKTGPILVALQVALSLAILANALHIVNERRGLAARPSGMLDEHAVFRIEVRTLSNETPEQQLADIKRQTEVLRAVGGVASVAQVSQMPMSTSGSNTSLALDPRQNKESTVGSIYVSGDSLIKTFGLKLVEGRDFLAPELVDVNEATENVYPPGVIITRPLAEKLWPGASAIGKTMYFGTGADAQPTRILGVVENLISAHAEFKERAMYSVIIPQRAYGGGRGTMYAVRAEPGQRDRVMKETEAALRKSSPLPLILELTSTDEDRSNKYRSSVTVQWMLITVSLLLLVVTCCGIVGMASLWVTQRRKQIGVRRALGARKFDILRYFIAENFMITSAGVFGGVALGLALNQLLVSKLEMARLPGGYLIAGAVVFWLLGILASYGPAWRAASISPATATRSV